MPMIYVVQCEEDPIFASLDKHKAEQFAKQKGCDCGMEGCGRSKKEWSLPITELTVDAIPEGWE